MDHPTDDDFWQSRSIERRHDQVRVPALNIAGWYDIFLDGSLRNFTGVQQQGATEEARAGSRLLLGPWTHTTPPLAESGAVDFGARAGQSLMPLSLDVDGLTLRFFDRWLKGIDDGYDDEPPVRLFVMGEDVWRSENEWPLARAVETEFFLSSGGNANSIAGDGTLANEAPGDDRPDIFLYDPFHPVPTVGGQLCCYPATLPPGAFDQRPVEARSDVLVYTTPPLEEDTEVTGPVRLHLWAATTAPDTDFTGKLVDIYPDGYARNLTDGIIRARYRQGTDAAAADHARSSRLRIRDRPLGDQQSLPQGAPHRSGGEQQQLPALRPQPQHRSRARRGRGDAAGVADDLPRSSVRRAWCCRSCLAKGHVRGRSGQVLIGNLGKDSGNLALPHGRKHA